MTLSYSHHDRRHAQAAASHRFIARAFKRIGGALKMIHQAIAAAKIQRLRNELRFHAGVHDWTHAPDLGGRAEKDVAKYPRRPLVLGDKWDF